MNDTAALLDTLAESEMYRSYQRAFSAATGLPLALRPVEAWQPPLRGKDHENRFCALMAGRSATCAACLQMQQRISEAAGGGPTILKCHFGLSEAAVPVKVGERTIGYLATGQVLTQEPSAPQLDKVTRTMLKLGVNGSTPAAMTAYKETRVMPRAQLAGAVQLLATFAEHLSDKCNQLAVRNANAEPIAVVRAKAYIREHLDEDITLTDVARAACTSTFYICKLFKRHTGVNFTEYVSRLRTERAKEMLANPNLRVSEIAFEVGFQSLTHFNRVFRGIVGEAPTTYREKLALPLAA
jgi:AraC-like DNA-binding protein/ligand-binding sensor protein